MTEKIDDYGLLKTTVFLAVTTSMFAFLRFIWEKRRISKIVGKIPGPEGYPIVGSYLDFIGGATPAVCLNTVRGYFDTFDDLFKFWMGPKLYFGIIRPEYLEIILNHPDCLGKGNLYRFLEPFLGFGLLTAPVEKWRKNRKLVNPAFNQKILDSFVEVFNEQAKVLTKILQGETGKDFNILELVSACNIDTICETAMGVKVNAQTSGNQYGKKLDTTFEIVMTRMFSPMYNNDLIFRLSKLGVEFRKNLKFLHSFSSSVIVEKSKLFAEKKRRIENGEVIEESTKWKTFLEILLQLSESGRRFTNKEICSEVDTFMAAGSDTTAAAICFSCIVMGIHPEIQQKLYDEVVDVLGEDRDVTPKDLPRLEYMGRFIKETLRLFPTGPILIRSASTDVDIRDAIIPANSSIVISTINLHRSPKYWKDPLKFDPDRFLPEEVAKRHPYTYIPFSGGPRGCIGSKYAEMAIKSILCTIIRKFVFKTEYKSIEEIDLKVNVLLRPVDGFKVTVEARE